MFESLKNLPAAFPSFFRSLKAGQKRRQAAVRHGFAAIEGLEARELLSAANGHEHGVPRIINGTTTSNFTAVGQLTFTPTGAAAVQSTGTLIDTQWVLTAATASKGLTLTGGTASVVLGGTTYTVDQIVNYPKYAANGLDYRQDIALWHLSTAVNASIVPLNVSATPATSGNTVTLVGFGGTGTGTTGSNHILGTKQTANTKVERISQTQLVWKLDNNNEGTTADGDIGSPVLKQVGGVYQIFGVSAAHSTTTYKTGDLSYSTRTDVYTGWIEDVLGRAHTTTGTDDYSNLPDLEGTGNRRFTFSSSTPYFDFGGKFENYGDVDVFKLVTQADGYMTLDLKNYGTTSLLDTKLELLAADGTTVLATSDDLAATNLNSSIGTFLATGTYFVRVSAYNNEGKGSWRLTMRDNFDNVGDDAANAKTLTLNSISSVSADVYMNTTTDVDYFKFKANKTGTYQFDFSHTNPALFDPMIEVFNATGTSLGSNDDISLGVVLDARMTLTGITSGQYYYLKLTGFHGSVGLGKLSIRKIA